MRTAVLPASSVEVIYRHTYDPGASAGTVDLIWVGRTGTHGDRSLRETPPVPTVSCDIRRYLAARVGSDGRTKGEQDGSFCTKCLLNLGGSLP